jgi:O-antigen/teichoic acid export membrane protein
VGSGFGRVAKDSVASVLRFALTLAIQFAMVPYFVDRLGDDGYGLWTLTFSVLGFLGLVDFGFSTSVVRFTAEARGSGDAGRRNRLLSTVMAVYLVLAAASAAGIAAVSPWYAGLMGLSPGTSGAALVILWVLAARSFAVSLPFGMFRGILFGNGRIALQNAIQMAGTVMYAGASIAALETGGGIVGLAVANLAAFLAEHLIYLVAAVRTTQGLRVSWRLFDRSLLREALSISVAQFVVTVSSLVLLRADPLIVNAFLPLSAVALYGVALKVAESALMLVKQGINVLGPLAAELGGAGRRDDVRRLVLAGSKFALAPAVALAAAVAVLGREALEAWIGPSYGDGATSLFLLVLSVALLVPQMVVTDVFSMTGEHRRTALAAVASMAVKICASISLAAWLGLDGIALGTLVSTVVVDVGLVLRMTRTTHGLGFRDWGRHCFWPAVVPSVASAAFMAGLSAVAPPGTLPAVAAECCAGAAVFALAFWFAGMSRDERLAARRLAFGRS